MLFVLSNTKVVNSRFFKRQNVVWRRRQSSDGVVFTTRESVDLDGVVVHKKRPTTEAYQPGKLFISLLKACDHLENPKDTAWQLARTVEEKLVAQLDSKMEITSEAIAQISIDTLRAFNITAYIKYASYQPELVSSKKLSAALRQ